MLLLIIFPRVDSLFVLIEACFPSHKYTLSSHDNAEDCASDLAAEEIVFADFCSSRTVHITQFLNANQREWSRRCWKTNRKSEWLFSKWKREWHEKKAHSIRNRFFSHFIPFWVRLRYRFLCRCHAGERSDSIVHRHFSVSFCLLSKICFFFFSVFVFHFENKDGIQMEMVKCSTNEWNMIERDRNKAERILKTVIAMRILKKKPFFFIAVTFISLNAECWLVKKSVALNTFRFSEIPFSSILHSTEKQTYPEANCVDL